MNRNQIEINNDRNNVFLIAVERVRQWQQWRMFHDPVKRIHGKAEYHDIASNRRITAHDEELFARRTFHNIE